MEELIFPDFDDIAAPPKPIGDIDKGNNADQVQVSDECPKLEDSKKIGLPQVLLKKSQFFSRKFQSQGELHRRVVSVIR